MDPSANRKRRRLFAAAGVLLLVALSTLAAAARHRDPGRRVIATAGSLPNETTETTETATSEPPSSTAADTTGSALSTGAGSSTPPSPWTVGPTTGIGNFDSVSFDGTGLPAGTYAVGQCPTAAARAGDFFKCHSHLVTVTDGHLVSTVTVGWWIAGVDCGTAPGTCLVGVMNTNPKAMWAPVSWNLAFDTSRRPTLEVMPNTGLVEGEQVEVRGSNFGPARISVQESCPLGSCGEAIATSSTSAGDFATGLTIHASYENWSHGADMGPADCDAQTCSVVVTAAPEGQADVGTQWILSFALGFAPVTTPAGTVAPTPAPGPTTSTSPGA